MTERRTGRAVLYARKSTKQDRSGEQSSSVADQIKMARRYADEQGWEVVGEYTDDGRSGLLDRSKRPGLDAALTLVEDGKADRLVMWWKSRLSRDELDRATMLRDLQRWNCEWHAVADGGLVDRTTYGGYVRDKADEMIDTSYSIRVRENWRRVHERRLETGQPKTGNPRFGYRRDTAVDRTTGREYSSGPFEVDPVTGPILTDLYRRYTAGSGFTPLVKWLNEQGVTTTAGAPWTVRSLARTLDSGFAAGYISKEAEHRHRKGSHERLITDDEWEAYLRVREAKRGEPPRRKAAKWYLAGIVRCGLCGGSVFVNSYGSPRSHIICSNWRANKSCSGRMRMYRRDVEAAVAIWLGGHLDDLAAHLPSRDAERGRAETLAQELSEDLDRVQAALGRLGASFARGIVTEDAFVGAQADLIKERDDLKTRLGAARDEITRLGPVDLDVFDKLERAPEMSPGEYGSLIGRVLRRVEVSKQFVRFVPVVGEPEVRPR